MLTQILGRVWILKMVKKQRIYAIYHDDRFVDVGTKEELMD